MKASRVLLLYFGGLDTHPPSPSSVSVSSSSLDMCSLLNFAKARDSVSSLTWAFLLSYFYKIKKNLLFSTLQLTFIASFNSRCVILVILMHINCILARSFRIFFLFFNFISSVIFPKAVLRKCSWYFFAVPEKNKKGFNFKIARLGPDYKDDLIKAGCTYWDMKCFTLLTIHV